MDSFARGGDRLERLRRWIYWVLVLGFVGTETELLLLEHYDDPWQFVPLVLVALGLLTLIWYTKKRNVRSLKVFRIVMTLFILAGFVGLVLHFRGAAEFQLETDPNLGRWELARKVMRVKAPPVLAPGVMVQLGLIGLAYALQDPRDKKTTEEG
jgi:hypothetical protein